MFAPLLTGWNGTFLAQSFPSGLTIPATVLAAVATGYYLVNIWDRTRSKPPAHDVYATKPEVDRMETRMRTEISALNDRSENRSKENRDLIQDRCTELERNIVGKISDNKENTSTQFGELRGELHAVRGTMQAMSNELMRSLGQLEGAKKTRS
jgi:hypothetical protein